MTTLRLTTLIAFLAIIALVGAGCQAGGSLGTGTTTTTSTTQALYVAPVAPAGCTGGAEYGTDGDVCPTPAPVIATGPGTPVVVCHVGCQPAPGDVPPPCVGALGECQ